MTNIETIGQWCNDAKSDMIAQYLSLGLKASGQWEKELESKIEENQKGYQTTFLGTKYSQQLIAGRRPNKKQDKDSLRAFAVGSGKSYIKDWVEQKGIDASPIAIAYEIGRSGYLPKMPNLLNDIFTDDRIGLLLKSILAVQIGELRTDIKTKFDNGNNSN